MTTRLLTCLILVLFPTFAVAQNLLSNGSFDSNITGWEGDSLYTTQWSSTDADDSATSGSLEIDSDIFDDLIVESDLASQCVPAAPGRTFIFGGDVFVPTGQSAAGRALVRASSFASADCSGNPLSDEDIAMAAEVPPYNNDGVWVSQTVAFVNPFTASSLKVQAVANDGGVNAGTGPTFVARFDNLRLQRQYADIRVTLEPRSPVQDGAVEVEPGASVIFDIAVEHLGPTTENPDVFVTAPVPTGLTFSGSVGECTGTAGQNGGTFQWDLGSMSNGDLAECGYVLSVPDGFPPSDFTITAIASSGPDFIPANNTDAVDLVVPTYLDLAMSLAAHRLSGSLGDVIRLNAELTNVGNDDGLGNASIVLPDGWSYPPPASYSFTTATDCPDSSLSFNAGTNSITWSPQALISTADPASCSIAVEAGGSGEITANVGDGSTDSDSTNNFDAVDFNLLGSSAFTVDSDVLAVDGNPGDGVCEILIVGGCSITAAIDEANALPGTDRIIVPAGNYRVWNTSLRQRTITESLVIEGAGSDQTTLLNDEPDRSVLAIDGAQNIDVIMRGLTLTGGDGDDGGALRQTQGAGSLTLKDVVISGNAASGDGGGVWSQASLALVDSRVEMNTAVEQGGAIHFNPLDGTGELMIKRSIIDNNEAFDGGGVYLQAGSGASMQGLIRESTVSNNRADRNGGGVMTLGGGGAIIANSTLSDNSAQTLGGGVYVALTSDAQLYNATVARNTYDQPYSMGGSGGGIYIDFVSTARAVNSILVGNGFSGFSSFLEAGNCGGIALELGGANIIQLFFNGPDPGCSVVGNTGSRIESNYPATLEDLADNGGPTLTHDLVSMSSALDAGSSGVCTGVLPGIDFGPTPFEIITDQRGLPRERDGDGTGGVRCDVGAVEFSNVASYDLEVNLAGNGTGEVILNGTVTCDQDCIVPFDGGSVVNLTASPDTGSTFLTWDDDCSGDGACSVTMNDNRVVTAEFAQVMNNVEVSVQLTGSQQGTVTSVPAGISCPGSCSATYIEGDSITLTATPAAAQVFVGWSGACSGTGACELNNLMNDATVEAEFTTSADVIFSDGFESQ